MNNIQKIFGNIKFTQVEEKILNYLIDNIDTCSSEGLREIAKKNFSSPSTIIRLSKKLGYSGFVEFIYSLKEKLSEKDKHTFFNLNDKNLFSVNYENAVSDFIKCIDTGNILISGEGFSEIVSKYIYMKLLVLGKKSILSTFIDLDILFDNHVEVINSVILISKSGEGKHCVDSCLHAQKRNLKIISFTGNPESTLAKNSDIIFLIQDCNKLDSDNYNANPFFAHCIETFELIIYQYLNQK